MGSIRDIPPVRAIFFGAALACLWLGTIPAAGETGPGKEPRSEASASLFNMPAETFFALNRVGFPIDARRVDQTVLAAALFHETNLRRGQYGKHRLRHDPRLEAAARMHAASMVRHNYLSHIDPNSPERRTPRDRALLAGFKFRFLAENIATHFDIHYETGRPIYPVPQGSGLSHQAHGPPIPRHTYRSFAASLLEQWMNSPEHRHNILADQPEFLGADCRPQQESAGMHTFYCVQLFGSPPS